MINGQRVPTLPARARGHLGGRVRTGWHLVRILVVPDPAQTGGRRLWSVESNAIGKGYRLVITIDDVTGRVIAHREYPR
jgi:hypothetical protein